MPVRSRRMVATCDIPGCSHGQSGSIRGAPRGCKFETADLGNGENLSRLHSACAVALQGSRLDDARSGGHQHERCLPRRAAPEQ